MFFGLSFRHSNNHLWRVTCQIKVPLLLSFAWPLLHPALRQLHQLMGFAYSQFQTDNHLLLSQPNLIPNTWTYTHTHNSDPHHQLLRLVPLGGGPSVVVVLISSHAKTHLKEYRTFAWSIATMRLPPIWESGSVWTLSNCGCQKIRSKLACITRILWMCLDSCTPCTHTMWSFSFSTIATIWAVFPNDINIHQHYLTCQAYKNSQ